MPDPNATRSAEPAHPPTPAGAAPCATSAGDDPVATVSGTGTRTDALAPPLSGGRYELVGEIARGGMGVVYRATDTAFAREVAVKVLLDRFAPTSGTARRFHDEARITGQLQHPNIPAVHDLGTLPDGRPFLAMKLIRGHTLDALLASRPDTTADRGRFVAAFEQLAQGVAFAHARGIVHRDLKPSNVMVGDFGEAQVMDWGLAKALGAAHQPARPGPTPEPADPANSDRTTDFEVGDESTDGRTQLGQVMGTPAYIAPEQARGESVDRRADVFALGGVLCAILTGKPPFSGRGADAIQKAAAGNLSDAFERLDACGADAELVALCRHCLSANPADRPADAGAVARLVGEYRTGVEQRLLAAERDRAAAEVQAVEQRKRRKVQLALVAAFGLIVCGGAAFAWYSERQAADLERAARDKQDSDLRQQEKDDRAAADNRRALVEEVGRCESALRTDDADTAAAALVEIARREPQPGGAEFADRIARCRADHAMPARLNWIDDRRWTPVRGLAPPPSVAAPYWTEAFAAYGIVPGTTPPAEVSRMLARSPIRERLIGGLELWHAFGVAPGLTAILREVDPDPVRTAIRDAIRDAIPLGAQPGAWGQAEKLVEELAELPGTRTQPTRFVAVMGILPEIPAKLRRALLERVVSHSPNDFAVLMGLGSTYPAGWPASAGDRVRWFQAAAASRPRSYIPRVSLGIALWDEGKRTEAVECFRGAAGRDPENAWNRYNLGKALKDTGDPVGALTELRAAVRLDPNEPWIRDELGNALWANRDLDGAMAEYREAVRLDREFSGAHYHLGNALRAKRDLKGAIAEYRESLRLDPGKCDAINALGNALWDTGNPKGAEEQFRKAIAHDKDFAPAHNNLGALLKQRGDLTGAVAEYREVIRIDPKYTPARYNLGIALWAGKDAKGAVAAYRELLAIDPTHINARINLAYVLDQIEELDASIAEYREVLRLDPDNARAKANLRDVLKYQAGRDRIAPPPREVKR